MNTNRKIKIIGIVISACCVAQSAMAQYWPLGNLVSMKPKMQYDHMQYDYKVTLENVTTATNVDSMYGHLVISGRQFIDSNKLCYIAKNNTQYCKLDHIDKTATIFSLEELSKKIRMPLIDDPVSRINITEELMSSPGQYHTIDVSSPMCYRISFTFKDQDISYAQLDFKKADSTLMSAYFQLEDKEGDDMAIIYRRSYHIYNIRSTVREEIFDLSRIFRLRDGQPTLTKKYNDYKLIKLMQ